MLLSLNGIVVALALVIMQRLLAHRRMKNRPLEFNASATVLITGASSGIGLEIAKVFAASHCRLVLVGRSTSKLEDAAEACRKLGAAEIVTVSADVATEAGVLRIVSEFKQRYRQLTYLVLNAGQGAITRFDSSPEYLDICRKVMEVNYFANVRLLQAFVPLLDHDPTKAGPVDGEGSDSASSASSITPRILIISSLAGVFPSVFRSAYTASKHALQGFSNALRQELKFATLTIACPGFVDTPFHQHVLSSSTERIETAHSRPGAMTAERCARDSLRAMRDGDSELVMTLSGRIGYVLRPWIPQAVDDVAKKKVLSATK